MNKDQLQGKWKQFKGSVQERWGELTGDEIDEINGDATQLEGKIQERYGKSKEEAKKDVNEWLDSLAD
ncbi:MAG: CsbD family protein [Phototrophicaceae bacterium]